MGRAGVFPASVALLASGCLGHDTTLVVGAVQTDANAGDATDDAPTGSLLQGLVGYWKLDNRRAVDSSGNGNHATTESVSVGDWQTGHIGGGLWFNNAGWMKTNPSDTINSIRTALTITAWLQPLGRGSPEEVILQRQVGATAAAHFAFHMRDRHAGIGGQTTGDCDAATTVPSNRWVHLGATYDGRTQRVWIDGVEVKSCDTTGAFAEDTTGVTMAGALVTAATASIQRKLVAVLDEVTLYARALSASEMRLLADGRVPPVTGP